MTPEQQRHADAIKLYNLVRTEIFRRCAEKWYGATMSVTTERHEAFDSLLTKFFLGEGIIYVCELNDEVFIKLVKFPSKYHRFTIKDEGELDTACQKIFKPDVADVLR